ncbi:MAG: DUF1987 domain-containing protein [Flavobacteriales bacterium]|nr:DUF1987 domain-containing protein [Flavobacteriales bacterium]
MTGLRIEATKSTPEITLNAKTHIMVLKGRSLPENTRQFYDQIKHWLNSYAPPKGTLICIDVSFTYVSSSSLIALLSILKQLKEHTERGCELKVKWYYEKYDDDLLSIGEDMQHLADVEFEYLEIPD